ncbi:lipopolysaccharide assembly protein LapB [Kiloniella sp. EL199]|uniref:tetratricopeptide repeat protein n=1 Tax=Kiloniella sp. EL199 TaxID=2107581 RepID=UPI0013C46D7F|nr:tetratricopeptide repeat protein [Kiloniella sp. EL199]
MFFSSAPDAQEIPVRAGIHPGYGRIVFDWPRQVSYSARIDNEQLIIEFDNAADYRLDKVLQGVKGFTGKPSIGPDKKVLTFPLLDDFSLKTFKAGTKVIVDLRVDVNQPQSQSIGKNKSPSVQSVGFRFAEHPDYNRLVFDWPEKIKGALSQSGSSLTVRFDKDATVDLRKLNKQKMPFVQKGRVIATEPKLIIEFGLVPQTQARLFNVGPKSVIDVQTVPEKPVGAKPNGEQKVANSNKVDEKKAAANTINSKNSQPKKEEDVPEVKATQALDKKIENANEGASITLPELQELAGPGPLSLLPKPVGSEATQAVEETVETEDRAKPAGNSAVEENGGNDQAVISNESNDPVKPSTGNKVSTGNKKRLSKPQGSNSGPVRLSEFKLEDDDTIGESAEVGVEQDLVTLTEPLEIPNLVPPPGRTANLLPPTILNFNWDQPTGAVVFRRGEHLWLVFDREGPDNLAEAIEAMVPHFAPVDTQEVAGATVIRLSAPGTQVPRLSKADNTWTVDIRRRSPLPVQSISNVLGEGEDGPEVRFLVKSVSRLLSLSHPELGDRLIVAPIGEPNLGSSNIDEFPQFRSLPSYQGVVLQPTAEGLVVALTPRAVVVRSRDQLIVSDETARSLPRSGEITPSIPVRMLNLGADRLGSEDDYLRNLQDLQQAAVETTGMQQGLARLDLARFFFAHGRVAEAAGMLKLIGQENRRLSDDPSYQLLLGASQFLSDKFDEAQKTLSSPVLAGEWEANLWQAALAASGQDWGPAAIGFTETEALIEDFPRNIRNKLYLLAADSKLHVGDTGSASLFIGKALSGNPTEFEKAQADFLEGQRLLQDGFPEEARAIWKGLKYNRHRPTSARARHALTKLGIDEGTITQEEGIEQLEQLRFAWRGDKFEFAILSELGDRYADILDFRKSLHSLRQAASYFPHSERADKIAKRMQEIFEGMYIEDGGERIPPLSSIALYEEFKELTPLGDKGDTMITKLADRLVDVDLLEQAGNLLEEQVEFRLEGEEKARVGSRLALIRLLEKDAEESLAALDKTSSDNLPKDLIQQRLHLRARALAELSQEKEALDLLAKDQSLDALRLKADILWKQRKWDEAGKMLGKLIPASPPTDRILGDKESQAVINLAIAQTLSGDNEGLKLLRDSYSSIMSKGTHSDTFKLLTNSLNSGSVTSIADELKQVSQVQAFMDQYRSKLKSSPLSEIN